MYPTMLSRGPDVDIEPYYCLPVGTMQTATGGTANVPWSQPTSPTPPSRFSGPLSPTHPAHRLTYPKKNDDGRFRLFHLLSYGNIFHWSYTPGCSWKFVQSKDLFMYVWFFVFNTVHGSAASLLSGGSSLYGSAEERQANEVRRLKRELVDARDQVMSLSSQLSTNVSLCTSIIQLLLKCPKMNWFDEVNWQKFRPERIF